MSDLKERFEKLKNQWYDKRNSFSSSLRGVCDIPEYFKIISLGPKIVPFIIEEFVGVKVKIISVGYEREQTIRC